MDLFGSACSTPPASGCDAPRWRRAATYDESDGFCGTKTSTSCGLFLRKRTLERQESISRSRAAQLSALYELSDIRNADLNKNPEFGNRKTKVIGSPSVQTVSPQDAAATFRKNKQNAARAREHPDSSMIAHETNECRKSQVRNQHLNDGKSGSAASNEPEKSTKKANKTVHLVEDHRSATSPSSGLDTGVEGVIGSAGAISFVPIITPKCTTPKCRPLTIRTISKPRSFNHKMTSRSFESAALC